jgi:cell wall-associated NlpC family hydrolase
MRARVATRVTGVVAALVTLGSASALGVRGDGTPRPPDAAAARVLAAAKDQVGDAYRYGGNGPDHWDCSGLTSVLWSTAGGVRSIPRTSRDQQAWAWPLEKSRVLPGDLVFFGDPVTHVGLYLGDGRIVDASSSKGRIVERAIWSGDVVRYGRVPRASVARPPAPKPKAKPAATQVPKPSATPAAQAGKPTTGTSTATAAATAAGLRPIPKLGHQPRTATTKQMAEFVAALRKGVGHGWSPFGTGPTYDSAGLVRKAWRRAGFGTLPATPAAIERRTRPVALRDLAVGDLIFWGAPAVHVGVYVGGGYMIDASKVLRLVSRRPVFASETVRFARLTPRR